MTGTFRFRWWYLLLLLPLLLYFAADWYVGQRIEGSIARANAGDNSLSIRDYRYGFFPIGFTATGIRFDQDRNTIAARGSLSSVSVRGVNLLSLLTGKPITVREIRLRGMDAALTRQAAPATAADSSSFALHVSALYLDSIFLDLTEAPTGRKLNVHHLGGTLEPLTLPLRPAAIERLRVEADTVAYLAPQDSTQLTATTIFYATEYAAVQVGDVSFRQGSRTDLWARDLRFVGVAEAQLQQNVITLDSISVAQLGGGAQVQSRSQRDKPAQASSAPPPALQLGTLSLPDVDLALRGPFGTAALDGALIVNGLSYRDSLHLESLKLDGKRLSFDNQKNLTIAASETVLEQGRLTVPLQAATVGPTRLAVPKLTVETGTETLTVAGLDYDSAERALRGSDLRISGDRITGTVASLNVSDIDRSALLVGKPVRAGSAEVRAADLTVHNRDGGSYRITAPELTLTGLSNADGLRIDRAQLTNGTLHRRGQTGKEDIVARGVYLDQYGIATPFEPTRLGPSKLQVDRVTILSEETPIDYVFDRIAYSSRLGVLTLDSMQRRNRLTAAETFRDQLRKSWLDFHFDGLRASGIAHDALLRGETIAVDSLTAADFRVLVVEDLSQDPPPRQKYMPIEALRRIGPRIQLRAARLSSTDIAYGVVDTVLDAKTIHFSAGTVQLGNLDTELSTTDSVQITFDATFERATPLHAEFALARDSSGRNYAIRGEFGQYDLSGINPLFEVAADAYIESGVIEGMQYRGQLKNEVLTGELTMLYHDLDVTLVGGGSWFKNLLSEFVLKKDNLRGEDFRQGKMYHEHSREKSFFNAYWKGLVSGMRSSALADIALQKELD
ncbi:hypothetical protein [Neolewinella sp.]|uniref:hypothetical protein n=1 Tax=Neolewinella sp. TaxID=2993543 RepID=UPI003B52EA28